MVHRVTAQTSKLATLVQFIIAMTAICGPQSHAQDATPVFKGPKRCQDCHEKPSSGRREDGVESFVTLRESSIWAVRDRHVLACIHIDPKHSKLAAQIYKNLGIENYEENWTNQRRCLSCHANWLPEQENLPSFYEKGVSCESCHGPSSNWDGPHSEADTWRIKTRAQKIAKGMIPVRHPVARAVQCFSCHIGDASQQKVVTHAMYAAGHPPLPNIEIESFSRKMPRHWRYLNEKGDFKHRSVFIKNHYGSAAAENDLPRTKAVVIGGVVALRFYLELLASQQPTASKTHTQFPELAAYDCSGCHHELKTPSWRQLRVDYGSGRPRMLEWPTLIAKSVSLPLLNHAKATKDVKKLTAEVDRLMEELQGSLASQPFGVHPGGKGKSVSQIAHELAASLIPIEEELTAMRYDKSTANDVIGLLAKTASKELVDFYSARQIADAYRTVQLELNEPRPTLEKDGDSDEQIAAAYLKQFNDWKCDDLKTQSESIDRQFKDTKNYLALTELMEFGCGVELTAEMDNVWTKEKIQRIRTELLESAAKYDARWFKERFGQIEAKQASN